MLDAHPRAHAVSGFLELAQQVEIVLTRKPRPHAALFAESKWAVALRTLTLVDDESFVQGRAVAGATGERRKARQALGIRSDVEQFLRAAQMVLRREVSHPLAPAPIVTEVHELLDQ